MKNKNFKAEQDPFARKVQVVSKIYHELFLLMKLLQTKPQIKNKNINCYDLYYTVIRIREENEDIDIQNDDYDNDYIDINDVIIASHYVGIKDREKRDLR